MNRLRLAYLTRSTLIASALMIGTLASTQSASAESREVLATLTIPFAFHMGDQTMPAGWYRVDLVSSHLVQLHGPDHVLSSVVMNSAIKTHAPDHGTIVFDRYGDSYFLRQIWTAGNTNGLEYRQTRAEKNSLLAKDRKSRSSTQLAFNSTPQH